LAFIFHLSSLPLMLAYQVAAPVISCVALPIAEFHRRSDAAEDLEEQMQLQCGRPDGRYGREIMWHPLFIDEYVSVVKETALVETTLMHQDLAQYFNQGRPLDSTDYGYLADILRDALAAGPSAQAALRLARALAWVEQAGAALLATEEGKGISHV
jgi:hypothetical protein